MCFRIVVPSIEAWLMADREMLAKLLGISVGKVTERPEQLQDAKLEMLRLAQSSPRSAIQRSFLPKPSSGRREGPEYASRLIEFIEESWDPVRAAENAPSLSKALMRLTAIATTGRRQRF
jgi:hypothetical protein